MPKSLISSKPTAWMQIPQFYKGMPQLRRHFEDRLADPHSADAGRFVWDYWHIPNQYTLLRTPAYHFFPKKMYQPLHEALVQWGRANLGCHDISMPWLSCYVDGCSQDLHGDLPHGPWAFVLSLTPWTQRQFSGGETLVLKPEILDFWSDFRNSRGMELDDIAERIPPRFNQLTVFDPRLPHGVRPVRGTHDPREGRLVIHGWFVQPRPFIQGALTRTQVDTTLHPAQESLADILSEVAPVTGTVPVRLSVGASGRLNRVEALPHTLQSADKTAVTAVLKTTVSSLSKLEFPKARGSSQITIPFVFQVD